MVQKSGVFLIINAGFRGDSIDVSVRKNGIEFDCSALSLKDRLGENIADNNRYRIRHTVRMNGFHQTGRHFTINRWSGEKIFIGVYFLFIYFT